MKLDPDDKLDDIGVGHGCANALAIIFFFGFFGWLVFGALFGGDWFK